MLKKVVIYGRFLQIVRAIQWLQQLFRKNLFGESFEIFMYTI